MNRREFQYVIFLGLLFFSFFCTSTVFGESTYLKSTIDEGMVLVPKHLDFVSQKSYKKSTQGGPRLIEMPYSRKTLIRVTGSLKALPGAARTISGRSILLSHPVYFGQLGPGERSEEQIILVNAFVKYNLQSVLIGASVENLVEVYSAVWDLKIPSLMNAYASILCDYMINEMKKELHFVKASKEQRELLVTEVCQKALYKQLTREQKAFVKKHLILYKLEKEEHTIYDYIGRYGQPRTSGLRSDTILDISKANLTSLQGIDLIRCASWITHLDISQNSVLGCLDDPQFVQEPFKLFSNVLHLNLHQNYLSQFPFQFFQGLRQLKTLTLYNNHLKTLHGKLLDGLDKLEQLSLGRNNLTCLPEGLFSSTLKLKELDLHNNRIKKLGHKNFRKLSRLSILDLSGNQLRDLHKDALCGMDNLCALYLNNNPLVKLDEEALHSLKELTYLYLNQCGLRWVPEHFFREKPSLEKLDLSSNRFIFLPQGIFRDLSALIHLNLAGNGLLTLPRTLLMDMSKLHALDLSDNDISYVPESTFVSLLNCKFLDIRSNRLKESVEEFRARCGLPNPTWICYEQNN